MSKLTYERLRQVLRYNPKTGEFWWIERAPDRVLSRPAGTILSSPPYLFLTIDYERLLGHRVAWFYMTGSWPKDEIDHKNRVKHDCRWNNLRPATHKQNSENSAVRSHSKSRVKGVYWSESRQKWHAYIDHNGRRHHLGRHEQLSAAKAARKAGEVRFFTHAI